MSSESLPVNLLAEESTIDPRSILPSFLEMELVNSTVISGRNTISSSIDAIIAQINKYTARHQHGSMRYKISAILSGICIAYKEELRMVINYMIERRCLFSDSGATLAESIYGFKRSRISSKGNLDGIRDEDRIRAAFIVSFWPYLKGRLDSYYERLRHERMQESQCAHVNITSEDRNVKSDLIGKIRKTVLYLYPFLHMSHDGVQLAYKFAYLIGRNIYYHPQWHILGLVARRVTMQDKRMNEKSREIKEKSNPPSSMNGLFSEDMSTSLRRVAAGGAVAFLVVGWLGKFRREIRRYRRERRVLINEDRRGSTDRRNLSNSSDNESGAFVERCESVIIPPPLAPPILHIDGSVGSQLPNNKSLCPICFQKRVNPTASSSGYVFCFKCLVTHIREHAEECPVTGLRCTENQVVRLFEPNGQVGEDSSET